MKKQIYLIIALTGVLLLLPTICSAITNVKTNSLDVTDIDGNVYKTVKIGTQTWMVENLKTTKFNDGTKIPNITDNELWSRLNTPAYCFYNNDVTLRTKYGALYNWYSVNTGKLAPKGWHVPSDYDWTMLENYLIANGSNYDGTTSGNEIAKSMAAATGWIANRSTGTIGKDLTKNNTSGFTGRPGGSRYDFGAFYDIGGYGDWWTSTKYDEYTAFYRTLHYNSSCIMREIGGNKYGRSVRCVRDH